MKLGQSTKINWQYWFSTQPTA